MGPAFCAVRNAARHRAFGLRPMRPWMRMLLACSQYAPPIIVETCRRERRSMKRLYKREGLERHILMRLT